MNDKPTPTIEQVEILKQITSTKDNILINALAGTGKTATLEMIQEVTDVKPILYLCFNKRIAEEAEKKFPSTTTIRTFNGQGHRIWSKTTSHKLKLDRQKTQAQFKDLISSAPKSTQSVLWDIYWEVIQGVALAKALGYIPEGKFPTAKRLITREAFHARLDEKPDDLVADLIDELLIQSIKSAYEGFIDFNDQIYMPALFGGTFPRFPQVWTDETQDLNPVNHALLDKLVKGRFVAAGDPWQSIYAFRGAVQGGMSELQRKFEMVSCDLSISFRCPKAVVEHAKWRVPHFKWMKDGGHVEALTRLNAADIPDGAAIICRNNAPLFSLALHLLAVQRSVSVAGSDIGPKVVAIMKKLGDESMNRDSLIFAINDWEAEKIAKQSTTAVDIAACMRVFAGFAETLSGAVAYAEHLFAQRGTIRLLTGHKAKGLEFDTVYHLDPHLLGQDDQDLNLRYVITTRSRDRLYEIHTRDIQW